MSQPQTRWHWVTPAWLSWEQAQTYTNLPEHILRALVYQRLFRVQGLYSRIRPTKINRDSIDELFRAAAARGAPIYWKSNI